jgi:hypothetical protein
LLGQSLDTLPPWVRETRRVPLGVYRGLRFGLLLQPQHAPDLYLEGKATRQAMLSKEHHGPRAVLNALERLAGGYGPESGRVRQDFGVEAQLRDYQARLGAPFIHEEYLTRLTELRDQLRDGLSGQAPEPGSEKRPEVSELAEKIKALKASETIEATPERTSPRRLAAEEPVTARIRRRAGAIPAVDAALDAIQTVSVPGNGLLAPTFQARLESRNSAPVSVLEY